MTDLETDLEQRELIQQHMAPPRPTITARQHEIMLLMIEHPRITIKEIGQILDISPSAVSKHTLKLRDRLGVATTAELLKQYENQYLKNSLGVELDSPPSEHLPKAAITKHIDPQNSEWSLGSGKSEHAAKVAALMDADSEPLVVPRELDGDRVYFRRSLEIAKLLVYIIAAFVLILTAATTLTGVLNS